MHTVHCSGHLYCHASPLPCIPLPHMPPAMHAPLPHKPPPAMHTTACHARHPATHAPCHIHPLPCMPPPCEQNDRCLWKHTLEATMLRMVKRCFQWWLNLEHLVIYSDANPDRTKWRENKQYPEFLNLKVTLSVTLKCLYDDRSVTDKIQI